MTVPAAGQRLVCPCGSQPVPAPPPWNPCREDGGTFHVVQFDPETGEVVKKRTHQGYRDDSTWSR